MPATTRSKTKPNTGNTPPSKQQPAPPKPPKRNTKGGLAQALKNPVSARENGVGLLEMLQGEQEQELDDALGGEGHNHSGSRSSARGHGRSRGRGRGGRGRGRNGAQSNQEMTLVTETLEAADTSNADRPNQNPSGTIQATLDEIKLDAIELETEIDDNDNDGFDIGTNEVDDHTRPDIVSTMIDDDSDEEYESWDGFGLPMQIDETSEMKATQSSPNGPMKLRASAKPRGQKTSVGRTGKRKAAPASETPRKRAASGKHKKVQESYMDEVTSQLGGFVDDEDDRSATADRIAVIDQKKISRRTPTSTVSITHSTTPKPKVVDARKIGNIPPPYREKFDMDFVPSVVEWVAQSEEPWSNPDGKVPLQKIHDSVYRSIVGIVDRHHPLIEPLKAKLVAWRVATRKRAQKLVDEHLNQDENTFPASSIREYIGWLKPATESDDGQDVPFMFSNGLGYEAAQLQGKYLNPLLLETFAVHFGSSGVSKDPMDCINPPPIGAFALSISAVERALESWKHGKPGQANEFSRGNWGRSTDEYVNGLKKISDTRWKRILAETQRFTPYKPRETTATPEYAENYRTKAPESDVEV